MEPKLPMPLSSPEMGGYKQPEVKSPERGPMGKGQETQELNERHETQPVVPVPISEPPAMPAVPQSPPALPQDDTVKPQPIVDDNPLSAKDDELIEKEWVDKAKKIVQETKTNPYQQEDKVSKLQADYIKKRYGKEIKLANN